MGRGCCPVSCHCALPPAVFPEGSEKEPRAVFHLRSPLWGPEVRGHWERGGRQGDAGHQCQCEVLARRGWVPRSSSSLKQAETSLLSSDSGYGPAGSAPCQPRSALPLCPPCARPPPPVSSAARGPPPPAPAQHSPVSVPPARCPGCLAPRSALQCCVVSPGRAAASAAPRARWRGPDLWPLLPPGPSCT